MEGWAFLHQLSPPCGTNLWPRICPRLVPATAGQDQGAEVLRWQFL